MRLQSTSIMLGSFCNLASNMLRGVTAPGKATIPNGNMGISCVVRCLLELPACADTSRRRRRAHLCLVVSGEDHASSGC